MNEQVFLTSGAVPGLHADIILSRHPYCLPNVQMLWRSKSLRMRSTLYSFRLKVEYFTFLIFLKVNTAKLVHFNFISYEYL